MAFYDELDEALNYVEKKIDHELTEDELSIAAAEFIKRWGIDRYYREVYNKEEKEEEKL